MAEVVQDTQQEFWRSPTVLGPVPGAALPAAPLQVADACSGCATEFMIGAHFCHACGRRRPVLSTDADAMAGLWERSVAWNAAWIRTRSASVAPAWRRTSFPRWMHYLHFHEIQRSIGLPTASLIAFIIGLGCVAGALGVSIFFKASNLAEFQAIQMWRMEWLLAATASFVAGILLKKPDADE